ncbi:PucR family transcriptional regulator [Spirillospora sp. CA-255316]
MSIDRTRWPNRLAARASPAGSDPVIDPVCEPSILAEAREFLTADAVEWGVRLAHSIAMQHSLDEHDEAASPLPPLPMMRLGTEPSVLATLASIAARRPVLLDASRETASLTREFVRRGLPLARQWAAITRGQQLIFSELSTAYISQGESRSADEMLLLGEMLHTYIRELGRRVEAVYAVEETSWSNSLAWRRRDIVRDVLAGRDIDIPDTNSELSYDVDARHHIAVVAHTSTLSPSTVRFRTHLVDSLRRAGATQHLVLQVGATELWAWGAASFPLARESLFADEVEGMIAVVGDDGGHLHAFRTSHRQARRVAKLFDGVSLGVGGRARFIDHRDWSLAALLVTDEGAAVTFMKEELGPLLANDPFTQDLRLTLRHYLEHLSPQAAARDLHLARNTVIHRLERIADILGTPLRYRSLERRVALQLASIHTPDGSRAFQPGLDLFSSDGSPSTHR